MDSLPRLLRFVLVIAIVLGPAAGLASATTIDDLIKLKINKVSDDVLIALIESDGSVFYLSADDILKLKQNGLSDKVIVAMLLTGTKARQAAEAMAALQAQQRLSTPVEAERWSWQQPDPPPPVTVNVTQTVTQTVEQPAAPAYPSYSMPVYLPVTYPLLGSRVNRPVVREPVYWGYGGQRRPDAWALSTEELRRAQEAGQTKVVVRK